MILQGNDPYKGPSFSLGNRIMRAVWGVVYLVFFRFSPRPFHVWRSFLLRLFGAKIGAGCHIYPGVEIWAPWNIVLGNYVGISDSVRVYSVYKISIGDYAVISQGTFLCGGTHDYNSNNFQLIAKPIEIGAYAWVCAEAFIHPGVVLPEGIVIGARAVVTKSLTESWSVHAGNPSKRIGTRKINIKEQG
jgi:putative colanic acid biosynthesis acetyltransferase WcaF